MLKKRIRAVLCFLLCATLLQGLGVLFCTEEGLIGLYPLCESVVGEVIEVGDASYTEYFPLREAFATANIIILGVDFRYDESYALATDILRSMHHNTDIGTVLVAYDAASMSLSSAAISADTRDDMEIVLDLLRRQNRFTDGYLSFLSDLWQMKEEYPPQTRYSGGKADFVEDITAQDLIGLAADTYESTNRAVLLVTDATAVHPDAPLLTLADGMPLDILAMQCKVSAAAEDTENGNARITLIQTEKLGAFNAYYATVSHRIGAAYAAGNYTESYATPFYFRMKNCKAGSVTPYVAEEETEDEWTEGEDL